jgi:hypothetical protein
MLNLNGLVTEIFACNRTSRSLFNFEHLVYLSLHQVDYKNLDIGWIFIPTVTYSSSVDVTGANNGIFYRLKSLKNLRLIMIYTKIYAPKLLRLYLGMMTSKRLWLVFYLEGRERYTVVFEYSHILLEISKLSYMVADHMVNFLASSICQMGEIKRWYQCVTFQGPIYSKVTGYCFWMLLLW